MKSSNTVFLITVIMLISTISCTTTKELSADQLQSGRLIYQDNFEDLDNWHSEGLVDGVTNPEPGIMRLD